MFKDFDILLCYRDSELSDVIRAIDGGKFSHSAHVRIVNGKVYIVEAQINGYHSKTFDYWQQKYGYKFIVLRKELSFHIIEEMDEIERKNIGKGYNVFALLKQLFVRLYERVTGKQARLKTSDKVLYCSKGTAQLVGLKDCELSPSELYQELLKLNYKQINIMPETVYKPIPEAVYAMLEQMEIPVNVSEDEIVNAISESVAILGGRPKRQ